MTSTEEAPRRPWWRRYYEFPLIWKFAIALVAGAVVGLAVGPSIAAIQPLGDLFLRLLQMLVMPLVIVTLVAGASSVAPSRLGGSAGRSWSTTSPPRSSRSASASCSVSL